MNRIGDADLVPTVRGVKRGSEAEQLQGLHVKASSARVNEIRGQKLSRFRRVLGSVERWICGFG
jgi:hypothetical protein